MFTYEFKLFSYTILRNKDLVPETEWESAWNNEDEDDVGFFKHL